MVSLVLSPDCCPPLHCRHADAVGDPNVGIHKMLASIVHQKSPINNNNNNNNNDDKSSASNSLCSSVSLPEIESTTTKRRKRVRFSEFAQLNIIPGLNAYSDRELEAMYLTPGDYHRIRLELELTVARMQTTGDLPDTNDECFRGLEHRGIEALHNRRKGARAIALSLLFGEQQDRFQCGYGNDELCPDWIDHVYRPMSEDAVATALALANWDEEQQSQTQGQGPTLCWFYEARAGRIYRSMPIPPDNSDHLARVY